jgi:anti-sigma regulatory factor (Ser/Thr protein kinase)
LPPEPAALHLTVDPDIGALDDAQGRVAAWLEARQACPSVAYKVRLVIEELLTNLMLHGDYPGGRQAARLTVGLAGDGARVTIEDAARPFDPRSAPEPPAPSLDDDRLGGLGLPLVRRMAARIEYGRTADGWNRTELLLAPDGGG